MPNVSRKQFILISTSLLLIATGGWLYSRRPQRVFIASYVPESSLGYLEITDWPQLAGNLTSTKAWQQLAPNYGIDNKLNYIGKLGWLARLTGGGEAGMLARSQFAIVITGLEVRGEEVRPRMALIAETHSSGSDLRQVIEKRLPDFARRIYGRESKETNQYGGVTVTSYDSGIPERKLFSAQIDSEWILANHPDSLRACIDTRLGRAPSLANNFYLQNSRPFVEGSGDLFGFITSQGVTRMLRFGAYLLSNSAIGETGLSGILEDVLTDFASHTSDGIAYGESFENGVVVDRYNLLFKPDLVESLKPVIKVNDGELQSLDYIPPTAKGVTVFNLVDPNKTLDSIEAAISARIGVGQSFLLHQFLIGARESFLGVKSGEMGRPSIGDEIASYDLTEESENRVWLIAAKDRGKLRQVIDRYLSWEGATVRREKYSDVEILISSNARRGSAVFIGEYLALGRRAQLIHLIESRHNGQNLKNTPQFRSATRPPKQSAVISFSSVKDDSDAMMQTLAQLIGGAGNKQSDVTELDGLPFATSATSLNKQGIYLESHSPFGNFPLFVSLIDDLTGSKSN